VEIPRVTLDMDRMDQFEAGPLLLALEYRDLQLELAEGKYTEEQMAVVEQAGELDDGGLTIHVYDAGTRQEHLRFDFFKNDPHYHYIYDDHMRVVMYDRAAHGPMWKWVTSSLPACLPEMLRGVGAYDLADRVDAAAVAAVMPDLEGARERVTARVLQGR
jgi:hypothetical protein